MQAVDALLAYCLSDIDPASAMAPASKLHRLPLCLAASGQLTSFSRQDPSLFIVTAEQAVLLGQHRHLLLAQQVRQYAQCTDPCLPSFLACI